MRTDQVPTAAPARDATARAVSLRGIAVDLGRTPVLRGLDLTVSTGEVLGVLGGNGSGKSTLLRVLATLQRPATGSGWVLGARLGTAECARVRPRICYLGHSPALYPQLSLRDNLRFVAGLIGRDDAAVEGSLAIVGLAGAADRRAEVCSQGMLRRTELARASLSEPGLLLLDEPHAGLDPAAAGLVDHVAARVCRSGGAVVLVSHEHDRLDVLAHRLVEIVGGRARARPRPAAEVVAS